MKRIMLRARPLQKGGKNAAAHLPRRPGSNTAFWVVKACYPVLSPFYRPIPLCFLFQQMWEEEAPRLAVIDDEHALLHSSSLSVSQALFSSPSSPGSIFAFTAGSNPFLDRSRCVIWREGNARELLRDLPELLGGLLIACSARNPGNCGHARQFRKAARTVVAATKSERAGRRIQGGKSPLRDLLPKTGDHPGDQHPQSFEEGGGASAKCRSGRLEIGQRGS